VFRLLHIQSANTYMDKTQGSQNICVSTDDSMCHFINFLDDIVTFDLHFGKGKLNMEKMGANDDYASFYFITGIKFRNLL